MDNTTEFSIDSILEEYLNNKNVLNEALELISSCRLTNPKRWAKEPMVISLATAFDWDLGSRGFDYWETLDNGFDTFKFKKMLSNFKTNTDISGFIELMNPNLVKFLISQNCLPNYIINCVNFIEEYGATHLDPPLDITTHLRQVRDIINAFRCSKTPEGTNFWRTVNEAFVNWRG